MIPEIGDILYIVEENTHKDGLPVEIHAVKVDAPYTWRSGCRNGFRGVVVADYENKIFPAPRYFRDKDIGRSVFLKIEEAREALERCKK